MKLKIKSRPEDFVVEESAVLPLAKKGAFAVYKLTKCGRNTVELLGEIARKLNIPYGNVSYGGRKDRHSRSSQFISLKSHRLPDLKEKDYSLGFIGFMKRPMGPDLIRENIFKVTVRSLSEKDIQQARKEIGEICSSGFPNYFDDQRFGSFDKRLGFFGQKLLKKQFNGALKAYLVSGRAQDKKEEKERKDHFFKNWGDWPACLSKAKTKCEREAFDFLRKNPKDPLGFLKTISKEQLSVYFSAYQAHLWNETLRKTIASLIPGPYRNYPGSSGDYLFYEKLEDNDLQKLEGLSIPVPGRKAPALDGKIKDIYHAVFEENGIRQAMFNGLKLRQAYFKTFERKALVRPKEFSFESSDDELYPGKKKLVLSFSLPRGSYATMLIKRIFCLPQELR